MGNYYVTIMSYIPGQELRVVLKKSKTKTPSGIKIIPQKEAKKYFYYLLQGLKYAHEVWGLVHRDLKPNNIIITEEDILKKKKGKSVLIDFGNAAYLKKHEEDRQK